MTQRGLDDADAMWGLENKKLLKTLGVKYFKISKTVAFNALTMTFSELGMTIENADKETGIMYATAQAPTPLTPTEWSQVKKIEEPRLKAIARKSVDPISASLWTLNPTNRQIRMNAIVIERKNDVQIQLNFSLIHTGASYGILYGKEVPTKAVEIGGRKFWDAFERAVLIQGKTLE